ncbi:MAG: uracil phosphoribosyltransferase [Holosporales bacterium]|jgi:uracil phosphoribosyltransferase|nr:uracil phosphoribosyltransferase [Holosporales bacterium]
MSIKKVLCFSVLVGALGVSSSLVSESFADPDLKRGETKKEKEDLIRLDDHPLIQHHLSIIRNKKTKPADFKHSVREIARQLVYAGTKNLLTETIDIETPVTSTKCQQLNKNKGIFVVNILRGGAGIADEAENILPNAEVHHLGMKRDETTLKPIWYYNRLPKTFEDRADISDIRVYVCDPMLATGGSICEAVQVYIDRGIKEENITLLCMISAPEGIKNTFQKFPKVKIVTACLDEKLNDKGYIVPGLGDIGDRLFNFAPS